MFGAEGGDEGRARLGMFFLLIVAIVAAAPGGCGKHGSGQGGAGSDRTATHSDPSASPDRPGARASGQVRDAAGQRPRGTAARQQPAVVLVPKSASGQFVVAPGTTPAPPGRRGKVVRYLVEIERGLPFDATAFAAEVHRILNDPRGWGRGRRLRFERTDREPVRVRVALSSPDLTDQLCLPVHTGGELSCWDGPRSVINAKRWGKGARTYGWDIASYREYVINHEVGHQLYGAAHASCPRPGELAPVMVQQTKSLQGCRPNPWPFPPR